MDQILRALAESVDKEDEASRKLYEARNVTSRIVRDNLDMLVGEGIVKLQVNRLALRRHGPCPHPSIKR